MGSKQSTADIPQSKATLDEEAAGLSPTEVEIVRNVIRLMNGKPAVWTRPVRDDGSISPGVLFGLDPETGKLVDVSTSVDSRGTQFPHRAMS